MNAPGQGGKQASGGLLDALYGSVLEEDRQHELNQRLAEQTGANIVAVLGHDVAHGSGQLAIVHGADTARLGDALADHDLHTDPWITRVVPQLATGKVINSDHLLPRQEMQRTEAFNRYYRQIDIGQQVASVAHYDGKNSVTLSICREVGAPAFSENELAVLQQLTPHWVNVYAIQRRLSWLQQRVQTLEQTLELLPTAMLLLNAQQQVVRMNAAAEALFADASLLTLQQRRPTPRNDPRPLQALLQQACRGVDNHGRVLRSHGSTRVLDANGRAALIVHAHPLSPQISNATAEAAIVFLQPVGAALDSELKGLLRTLFPLTTAEATLAEALFLHPDLALAATHAGISLSTAQTRLKVIYDKTGERGQPALLRLLSAIAAGAGSLAKAGR